MNWKSYGLDQEAQRLVLKHRDKKGVIGQSHKMRITVAFGLERFWGEQLRLLEKEKAEEKAKGEYWRDTWKSFVKIMLLAGIKLPQEDVSGNNTAKIQEVAAKLWELPIEDQRICLAVLTQFCDSLVWWTQRYKKSGVGDDE
ncbi:hypothetical protein [Calothrix sp. PCC 7507]|uniref:hypothetical protein n=1 Tax=Calothrix sp. PCC 7507 TaxID=99598 RepID=UPI00029F4A7A|nr:hypothetical protein [Calothrix sp. PCC 7507]AFY30685.1 hypothetical protein Cal7507_0183 [Calothrix sp. PCC 7507]